MTMVMQELDTHNGMLLYCHPLCFAEKRGLPELHAHLQDLRAVNTAHLSTRYCRFCQQLLDVWAFHSNLLLLSYDVGEPSTMDVLDDEKVTAVRILLHFTCRWSGRDYWTLHIFSYEADVLRVYMLLREVSQAQGLSPRDFALHVEVRDSIPAIYEIAA